MAWEPPLCMNNEITWRLIFLQVRERVTVNWIERGDGIETSLCDMRQYVSDRLGNRLIKVHVVILQLRNAEDVATESGTEHELIITLGAERSVADRGGALGIDA